MVKRYSKVVLAVTLVFLLANFNLAQSKPKALVFINDAVAKYNKSLRHDNKGVVETSIFNLMQVKASYPNAKFGKTLNELDRLVDKADAVDTRYKAFIALNFFNTNEWDHLVLSKGQDEINEVFSTISKDLESKFFEVTAK